MEGQPAGAGEGQEAAGASAPQQIVYVMPQDAVPSHSDDAIDLILLWRTIWNGKWIVVAITAAFALAAVTYALLATEWYRAEVLLAPAEDDSMGGVAAQLGGLASLAGISVGSGGSTVESIAVLKSREFAREFIEDQDLLTVLLADQWDADTKRWKGSDPKKWPDIRDAVKVFDDDIRSVREDKLTGLVTLSIEWTDPKVAADWANALVTRLNDRMREKAIVEADTNVKFLRRELESTDVVTLQQSIGRLLESELQKLMLARGNQEFAFRVMDRADPPKRRSSPKRALLVALATLFGGIVATLAVVLRATALKSRIAATDGP